MKFQLAVSGTLLILLSGCGGGGSGGSSPAVASDAGARSTQSVSASSIEPRACIEDAFTQRVIDTLNTLRQSGQTCGGVEYPPVDAVVWNCKLEAAAVAHSEDMANYNFFSHIGSDGLRVGARATAAEYDWSRLGENIGGGQTTLDEVFRGWLNSPSHCRMMMGESYEEAGLALRVNNQADYVNYWTLVLGKPL